VALGSRSPEPQKVMLVCQHRPRPMTTPAGSPDHSQVFVPLCSPPRQTELTLYSPDTGNATQRIAF
jgi:hypothetical protein